MSVPQDALSPKRLFEEAEQALKERHLSSLIKLSNETFDDLVNHEKVLIKEETKGYFCPLFLFDEREDIYYPLFFFESVITKEEETYLSRSKRLPIFNNLALSILSNEGVDVDDFTRINDIKSYLLSLEGNIQVRGLNDRFSFEQRLGFYDEEILYLNRAYKILYQFINGTLNEDKYIGLSSQIIDNDIEVEISKQIKQVFFSDYKKMSLEFDNYQGCKVVYSDDNFIKDFITYLIARKVPSGESLLFVVQDEKDEENLKEIFKNNNLDEHVSYINDLSIDLLKKKEDGISNIGSEKRALFLQKEQKYLKFINERNEAYSNPRNLYSASVVDDIIKAKKENLKLSSLDISKYSFDEFKKDYQYLLKAENYESIYDTAIKDHIFYGLSVSDKRRNYDEIIVTIIKIKDAILDFSSYVEKKNINDFDGNKIDSFYQFEEYGKDIAVLATYTGFPRKYFREQQEDAIEKIEKLKKLYQALSSSKLLISKICSPKIFDLDLEKTLSDSKSRFFLKRRHARKKLLSCLIAQNKESFESFTKILKVYLNYQKEIESILPEYIELYGPAVANMNSLIEIESNISCTILFSERSKQHPSYNMDNPIVKRCYKDKDVRYDVITLYRELEEKYQDIKKLLNRYKGYFLEDEIDYMKLSFSDLVSLISRKLTGSYREFSQYAILRSSLDDTSMLFRTQLMEHLKRGLKIKEFRSAFVYSLADAIAKRGKKRFRPKLEDYENAKKDYLSTLDNSYSTYSDYLSDFIKERQKQIINDEESLAEDKEILSIYQNKEVDYDVEARFFKQARKRKPLLIAHPKDLLFLKENIAKKVIIFNSSEYSYEELFDVISVGEHILFLEKPSVFDKRTQSYPQLSLSSTTYLSLFNFNSLPQSFKQSVDEEFNKYGYRIDKSDAFEYTIYNSENKKVAVLLPDVLIPPKSEMQVRSIFRKFIGNVFHIPLLIMSTISFLLEPEKTISELTNRISESQD